MSSDLFEYVRHPHVHHRAQAGAPTVAASAAGPGFNSWLALKITSSVGTMWCAYLFAALALVSLPDALHGGRPTIIAWIAQTFLQLVLLSVIMVGQQVSAAGADARSLATYNDADAVLHEALQIQGHLAVQDAEIAKIVAALLVMSSAAKS
jgi:hypothetical protein